MNKNITPIKYTINSASILFLVALGLVNYLGLRNHTLFHFLTEMSTIVMSCCLFAFTWILREKIDNGYFSVLGIGLLFSAFFDLLHNLSYENMALFSNISLNQSRYFWLAARFLQSLTFVVAPLCVGRQASHNLVIWIYAFVSIALAHVIIYSPLPVLTFPDGSISRVRIILELIVVFLFFMALAHVYLKKERFEQLVFSLIFGGVTLAVISEVIIMNASEIQPVIIGWIEPESHIIHVNPEYHACDRHRPPAGCSISRITNQLESASGSFYIHERWHLHPGPATPNREK